MLLLFGDILGDTSLRKDHLDSELLQKKVHLFREGSEILAHLNIAKLWYLDQDIYKEDDLDTFNENNINHLNNCIGC